MSTICFWVKNLWFVCKWNGRIVYREDDEIDINVERIKKKSFILGE